MLKTIIFFIVVTIVVLVIIIKTDLVYKPTEGPRDWFRYTVGDVVVKDDFRNFFNKGIYYTYYRNSLATTYLKRSSKGQDWDVLHDIVKEKTQKRHIPPDDSLVMHIRVGDVINWEYKGSIDDLLEGRKHYDYLYNYEIIENGLSQLKNITKIILVGGYHSKEDHTRSRQYIDKVVHFLESKNYQVIVNVDENSADDDFLYMCNSKYFMKSGGRFSNAICKIVEMKGNQTLRKSDYTNM